MNDGQARLPRARGPVSDAVIGALRGPVRSVVLPSLDSIDMLSDDDAQLALTCCYELHYRSFSGVDDAWEWDAHLLAATSRLERAFLDRLADEIGPPALVPGHVAITALTELAHGDGPSLSAYVERHATLRELREFLVHRSVYQRKEADPHTWAIPHLSGRAKAAMVAIQYDEYGDGVAASMHAELFATTMRGFGLDPTYGAYLDLIPGTTLATDNLATLFGLHRRWRAACVGHLALFEMTSVVPMGRYATAMQRLGATTDQQRFYRVHVEADRVHERVAQDEMVAGLLESEPASAAALLFGARALSEVERRFSRHLLSSWSEQRSSLREPLELAPELVADAGPGTPLEGAPAHEPTCSVGRVDLAEAVVSRDVRGHRPVERPGAAEIECELTS